MTDRCEICQKFIRKEDSQVNLPFGTCPLCIFHQDTLVVNDTLKATVELLDEYFRTEGKKFKSLKAYIEYFGLSLNMERIVEMFLEPLFQTP
jgi:hypothetical protein